MVVVSRSQVPIMVNKSDSASSSRSGTSTSVSLKSFAALDSEEWDSWISHIEDCVVINGWSDGRKAQFLAVRMRGAALFQLQSLATGVRENYATLKEALREKFVPKGRVELHTEFRARHRERDKKLPDLASSLRRLVSRACVGGSRNTEETPRVSSENA